MSENNLSEINLDEISKKIHKKDQIYRNEQIDVLVQILKQIGLSKNNLSINKDDIESESNKIFIKNKKCEIKYFYNISNWTAITSTKNVELNILRCICRYHGVKINIFVSQNNQNGFNRLYRFDIPPEIFEML
jgi:hypothetical protein